MCLKAGLRILLTYISDFNPAVVTNTVESTIGQPEGVNEIVAPVNVSVFPNPSAGIFNYELQITNGGLKCRIEVYNVLGEKVLSSEPVIRNSSFVIDLSGKPAGIYLYRVISEKGAPIATGKLVVE